MVKLTNIEELEVDDNFPIMQSISTRLSFVAWKETGN